MLLDDHQLLQLASVMKIKASSDPLTMGKAVSRSIPPDLVSFSLELYRKMKRTAKAQPCAWNKLLRRR